MTIQKARVQLPEVSEVVANCKKRGTAVARSVDFRSVTSVEQEALFHSRQCPETLVKRIHVIGREAYQFTLIQGGHPVRTT
jgi:hypothetical protein